MIPSPLCFGIALPGSPLLLDPMSPGESPWPIDLNNVAGCSSYLYAWAGISNFTENDVSSIVAMGCDEQIQ
ncbi:hypothetical protein F4680DRAFT_403114 [Xylaria scruposa]|nr:hypothetical protein F4680DRAFT_403114 [Xylaria scruposa]